jgi:membrane protein implicated in regulation of membrane protease activity
MAGWVVWVILACAFGVGEMLSGGFFLAPFALGAALAAVADEIAGGAAGIAVFVVASLLALLLVRPVVRRHTRTGPPLRTGAAALIGKNAVVLERIVNSEGVGLIRIGGEVWSARSLYDDEEIEPGTRVEVVDIKGATALVSE